MTNAERLAEIDARCAKATKGPWILRKHPCMDYYCVEGPDGLFAEEVVSHDCSEERIVVNAEDADFIAHAREDIPWLMKFARRLGDLLFERNGDR